MRILIVSQFYTPDITAAAYRMSETTSLLQANGHEVRVITSEPHKSDVKYSPEADRAEGVLRVPIVPYGGGGLTSYLVHYFSFVLRATSAGVKVRKLGWQPDIIWVTSPPLFTGMAGWLLSWIMHAPMVLDVRDIWPETVVAAGQISKGGIAFRLGKFLERFLYERACRITCVSRSMATYIETRTRTPVAVVYNGVIVGAKPHAASKQIVNRILYAGNLGRLQGLDALLLAFSGVVRKGGLAGWTVEFIGTGEHESELKMLAGQLGCGARVHFHGAISKLDALAEIARSRTLFIHLIDCDVLSLTIPSKVFDYMLMDRPILCGVAGEALSILRETGGNVEFASSDVSSLIKAIDLLSADILDYERRALSNSGVVRSRYSREFATEALIQVFEDALGMPIITADLVRLPKRREKNYRAAFRWPGK